MHHRIKRGVMLIGLGGLIAAGCTQTSRVAVLSDGDLHGKQLSNAPRTQVLEGEDCGIAYYLANAFRNAIHETQYDTLVDVEVTSTAGITPFQQCLKVRGWGLRSADLRSEP